MQANLTPLGRLFLAPSLFVLAFILLPVTVVVGTALEPSTLLRFPPSGLSFKWFAAFLDNESFMTALFRVSLPLGIVVAALATVIGGLVAIGLVRCDFRGKSFVESLLLLPVIIPQILLAIGIFLVHLWFDLTPTFLSLALAHVVIATPFVTRTVVAGLSGIDVRVEEAAQNLGAHPVRAFIKVTLPLLRSSIVSGAVFAFIVSFSDINLAIFLAGATSITLPLQILAQMQVVSDPTIAAASVGQIVVITALLIVVQWLFGRVRV